MRTPSTSVIKAVAWIAGLIAFVLTLVAVLLNWYWKPVLAERIRETVKTSSAGLYEVKFTSLGINVISGSITIDSVRLQPVDSIYQKMEYSGKGPRHLYTLEVARLSLNRIRPLQLYREKVLDLNHVTIEKARLAAIFTGTKRRPAPRDDRARIYQKISKFLRVLRVRNLEFRDARFRYIDHGFRPARITDVNQVTIRVRDLLIDSASHLDASRLYYTKDIYAEVNDYSSTSVDKNYRVEVGQFKASTAMRFARIEGFRLTPLYGEMESPRGARGQKNRYSTSIESAHINQVDFRLLNDERQLEATKLTLTRANLAVFRNRTGPDSLQNRAINFPQFVLKRFELETKLDTVHLADSRVSYSEYNPQSGRKGVVEFTKIDGLIRNLTNSDDADTAVNVRLTALLMDRGRFNLTMRLDLNDPKGAFSYRANVGRMDAGLLNTAIRPLSLIHIRSGDLRRMDFTGRGDMDGIKGSVTARYNDLKISLLERSENTSWLKRRSIASIFANVLIIESDNPAPGRPVRTINYAYERPAHSSFINMIWKGLSQGLLGTIGFDAETRREIRDRLRRMEEMRFEREDRRDDRIKRRQERRRSRGSRP